MNIPYVMKRCTKCGRWLVASTVNFHRQKVGKYGLNSKCKECRAERDKQWYEANKGKILEQCKQYREANKEKRAKQHKRYYKANKNKIAEKNKQYREANKNKIAEQCKRYYEANREKELERRKRRYKGNKEKECERGKQYHQSPQGQVVAFNSRQRRRAKEEKQGTGITKDQWLELMSFFNWKCAYSGETLTKKTRSIDHIVPLNSNGDNMIWNMVPMTRSLNSSKQAKDMLEWYRKQDFYSEARLAKIYEWQEYARKKWKK